jgi:hypothetical protein
MGSICYHIGGTKVRKKAEMVSLTKNLARLDSLVQLLGHSSTAPLAWPSCSAVWRDERGSQYEMRRSRKEASQSRACGLLSGSGAMMRGISVPMIILLIKCEILHCHFGNPDREMARLFALRF